MADDCKENDRSAPRNNWESNSHSFNEPNHVSTEASSSISDGLEHKHSVNDRCVFTDKSINMDYFAAPSKDSEQGLPIQGLIAVTSEENNRLSRAEGNDGTLTADALEFDWIEPSTPIRSCVLGSSEDDDSSSKSCSSDSREGMAEHFTREKDTVSSAAVEQESFGAILHEMPIDATQESYVNVHGMSGGRGGEDPPWKRWFGAWLSEAGRASTLCSLALAATVLGLVLVGSGWQHLQLQYQKFRYWFFPKRKIKESSSRIRRIPILKGQSCFPDILNA